MDMTTNFYSAWIAGFTVCASLIVSIGAQNLYVLRQAVHGEHVKACVALCVLSDGLLVALGWPWRQRLGVCRACPGRALRSRRKACAGGVRKILA